MERHLEWEKGRESERGTKREKVREDGREWFCGTAGRAELSLKEGDGVISVHVLRVKLLKERLNHYQFPFHQLPSFIGFYKLLRKNERASVEPHNCLNNDAATQQSLSCCRARWTGTLGSLKPKRLGMHHVDYRGWSHIQYFGGTTWSRLSNKKLHTLSFLFDFLLLSHTITKTLSKPLKAKPAHLQWVKESVLHYYFF